MLLLISENKIDLSSEHDKYQDYRFTKKFAKEAGVLTIPPSAFYSERHKHLGENYARFCFIKVSLDFKSSSTLNFNENYWWLIIKLVTTSGIISSVCLDFIYSPVGDPSVPPQPKDLLSQEFELGTSDV